MKSDKHPMQPLSRDANGVVRFKQNAIVRYLLDAGAAGMNELAAMRFDSDDRNQFAQLIGYSVIGFGELSYADPSIVDAADTAASELPSMGDCEACGKRVPADELRTVIVYGSDCDACMECRGEEREIEPHRQDAGASPTAEPDDDSTTGESQ